MYVYLSLISVLARAARIIVFRDRFGYVGVDFNVCGFKAFTHRKVLSFESPDPWVSGQRPRVWHIDISLSSYFTALAGGN